MKSRLHINKSKTYFSEDISEFLLLLARHKVRYVIVGGEAVIYYGHARLTGDIDIFYERTAGNVKRLYTALNEFWDNDVPGVGSEDELLQEGMILQFGVPPNRIDLMNEIGNVGFETAWRNKTKAVFSHLRKRITIYYIGLDELIKNKKAVDRYKDREDLKFLSEVRRKGNR